MHVKLYEDIARYGHIATTYDYPVLVNGRYVMSPSPIPKFDNPKMHMNPALQLFGAGREKRIYAVPPYTRWRAWASRTTRSRCSAGTRAVRCAARPTAFWTRSSPTMPGGRMHVCSDSDLLPGAPGRAGAAGRSAQVEGGTSMSTVHIREATETDLESVLACTHSPTWTTARSGPADPGRSPGRVGRIRALPQLPPVGGLDRRSTSRWWAAMRCSIMHNLAHRGTPSAIVEDVVVSHSTSRATALAAR